MRESGCAAAQGSGFDHAATNGLWILAKRVVDRAFAPLVPVMVAMSSSHWDLGMRPSVVLRAVALKALLIPPGSVAIEHFDEGARVRWFLGMGDGDGALDSSMLDEGERRLISNSLARQFVREIVSALRERTSSLTQPCCENAAFIGAWTDA